MAKVKHKHKPEQFLLRVVRGGLEPADGYTRERLRDKRYHVNDVLLARLSKPRNPRFFALAHTFGRLVAENIDQFAGLSAHAVLKRVQLEGNIACDEMALNFPGIGPCTYRMPRSLSFAEMDEGEFGEVYKAMCRYVAETYWPDLDYEAIEAMADAMAGE